MRSFHPQIGPGAFIQGLCSTGVAIVSMGLPMTIKHLAISMLAGLLSTMTWATPGDHGQFSGFSTKGNLSVWRINHKDGSVSLCSFEGHINEPVCYPWSAAAESEEGYAIISGDDVLSAWRINNSTGAVSLCEYKEVTEPPICTPWSTE